jgi:DNA-binding response OmpR family regulator
MRKDTALYVGSDCSRQKSLDGHLQSLGIDLHKASSIPCAKQKICENKYDLLLIQFEPAREHIFDFCRFTRHEHYEAVIIVLMARAMPIIEGKLFEFGVDDIAAGKQTFPAALNARIKRRLVSRLSVPKTNKIILKGGAVVDIERREVRLNGSHHRLKGVQHKLLQYFLENPHRAISREELLKSPIWDNSVSSPNNAEQGRAIDMAVRRLRRTIEADPANPQIITAVHGTGWILAKDAVL